MTSFADEVKGKKVLVFGVGKQGGGSGDAAWLTKQGANVRLCDKDRELSFEGQTKEQIEWAEMIIKNPGVPDDHELILYAKSRHVPVFTSIALVVQYFADKIIGVTGTRGKSTTCALITAMLERAFPGQVILGGNIPGSSGLALFDEIVSKKYVVLELSSFQLHNLHDLQVSPHISVVTNLYPDHLNRYQDMANYQKDKEAIVAYQKHHDLTLYNRDNQGAHTISLSSTGVVRGYSASEVADWQTSLVGCHNRENIAGMWAVGKALGISKDVCQVVVQHFSGLPHRLELIREVKGVTFINDTTATTPTATIKALQAFSKPIVWIVGGDTKNLPFDDLLTEIKSNPHLKKIVILGSKNIPDFVSSLKQLASAKIIGQVSSMSDAVALAMQHAESGEVVLLSPGFSSFDLFQNEFDRGKQFNAVVKSL